jgi:hypothetical protein
MRVSVVSAGNTIAATPAVVECWESTGPGVSPLRAATPGYSPRRLPASNGSRPAHARYATRSKPKASQPVAGAPFRGAGTTTGSERPSRASPEASQPNNCAATPSGSTGVARRVRWSSRCSGRRTGYKLRRLPASDRGHDRRSAFRKPRTPPRNTEEPRKPRNRGTRGTEEPEEPRNPRNRGPNYPGCSHFGRSRQRSCIQTHCAGVWRIAASIASVTCAVSATGSSVRLSSIGSPKRT